MKDKEHGEKGHHSHNEGQEHRKGEHRKGDEHHKAHDHSKGKVDEHQKGAEHKGQSKDSQPKDASIDLTQALEEAKNKAEENWNLFLRTRAEMDNVRRRADIDVDNARKYGIEKFARELIAVIDSLEHGVQVAESSGDAAYKEGMILTLKLCLNIFEKFGILRIDPIMGEALDPAKHEVISTQMDSKVDPNRIIAVPQKGFSLQDRVLRPARVVVSVQPKSEAND